MIEFKKEWAKGMDGGEEFVTSRVRRARPDVVNVRDNEVGHAIDYALATVCVAAETPKGATYHLDYIIKQLTQAKRNIEKETE